MEKQFKGMIHLLQKRMSRIDFPISKSELISQIGDERVKVDFSTEKTVKELVAPIGKEYFTCAAEFYCALLGSF